MNTSHILAWWTQRSAFEKNIASFTALLVAAALLWTVAVAPGLRTLRSFDAKRLTQQAQLQTMLSLQAQAQALKAQPRLSHAAAIQALQASLQQAFGPKAEFSERGDNAVVTLRGVSADALAQWLSSAREQARARPVQARLSRNANLWSGTLQMELP